MQGKKYVIGHMRPSTDTAGPGAVELEKMLPKNVTVTAVQLGIKELNPNEIQAALDRIEAAAAELAKKNVDVITMNGTPPVVFGGYGFDKKIIARINKVTPVPATTGQTSSMKAMEVFRAKRIALVVPWKDQVNRMLIKYLEDSGLEIGCSVTANAELNDMGEIPLSRSYELCLECVTKARNADCIYVPCSAWPFSDNIEPLEKETGLPVVASTQSGLWGVLRLIGIKTPIQGFGRLMREY